MNRSAKSLTAVMFSAILLAGLPVLAQTSSAPIVVVDDSSSPTAGSGSTDSSSDALNIDMVLANLDHETFINFLHHLNMSEISEGGVSIQRIANQQVRDFTEAMSADHQQHEELVKDLAARKGWTLYTYQPSTVEVAVDSELQGLTGTNFDIAFLRMQLIAHEKTLHDLNLLMNQISDEDLAVLTRQFVTVIQNHIQLAHTHLNLLWNELGTSID